MTNAIQTENALQGTNSWWFFSSGATTQIQMYADQVSLDAGSTINFFVSTQVATTTYTLRIFRLGWYGGQGGCLKSTSSGRVGVAQGYWNVSNTTLTNCPTAIIDSTTHNLEAGWTSTDSWAVPSNACTGVYLAQATDANGFINYCTFVVRGKGTEDYVYIRPVTTDAAYNDWGGYSLYTNPTVGVKVSFNRPDINGQGTAGLFRFELAGIHWLEKQGYNISYLTSVDLHANAAQIKNYKAMLSPGHDEYWSKEMRDGVESAITSGVGVGFLGANASYWQCRFGADNAGNSNRCITCYKVLTTSSNLSLDPFYTVDNTRVTSQWRDAVLNRPENKMIGIQYTALLATNSNVGWTVDASADTTYFGGTGLVTGKSYCADVVGYEIDGTFSGGPSNLKIIATTPVTDSSSNPATHHTTTYRAPSGALVFASGSIAFTWALDTYRWSNPTVLYLTSIEMQLFFANIMAGLIANKQPTPTKVVSKFGLHV